MNFNSLAPCGANRARQWQDSRRDKFQLTRPVWGEPRPYSFPTHLSNISTHSPRVGRTRLPPPLSKPPTHFNSLAPCGANPSYPYTRLSIRRFQLTRPVWGEPGMTSCSSYSFAISTHSPRVGRTFFVMVLITHSSNFNSLAPCGANHQRWQILNNYREFQLTRPVWGEPNLAVGRKFDRDISTHSPRVGRTMLLLFVCDFVKNFNSLAPCGANLLL